MRIYKSSLFLIVCLSMIVFTSGCSEQYKTERAFWQAEKAAETIFINEDVVSPYEFNQAVLKYENFIKKYPDSQYALKAKFKIAQLHSARKLFEQARGFYDQLILTNQKNKEICALAVFEKAQTYEKEGNWARALITFDEVIKKYRESLQSLSVHLYIARYYLKNKDDASAKQAFNAAIEFFREIKDRYPRTRVALICENLIIQTYLEQNKAPDAVDYIEKLGSRYKLGPETLIMLAKIYQNRLNNKEKAQDVYNRFLKEYPEHKLANVVKEEIEKLNKKD